MPSQGRIRLPSFHAMQTRRSQHGESPPSWQMIGAGKAANYNQQMQQQMGWSDPFQYYPERGLYYHEVSVQGSANLLQVNELETKLAC